MARPRKTSEERRDGTLGVRLSAAERAELDVRAAALGLTTAEFLRRRALDYRLPATVAAQRQRAVLATALLRIGVNLNQLTHRANAGREPPPDILRALADRIGRMLDVLDGTGADGERAVL